MENQKLLANLPCTGVIEVIELDPETYTTLHLETGEIIYFVDEGITPKQIYFVDQWGAFDFTTTGEKIYFLRAKETQEALKEV